MDHKELRSIHAPWMIDEYVKIILMLFWLSPPAAPVMADETIIMVGAHPILNLENKINGAIFCHTNIITHMCHSMNIMIWGNQKCSGANPDFTAKIKIIIIFIVSWLNLKIKEKSRIVVTIKTIDAMAWGIKYLMADSVELKFNLNKIRGITLIKFTSNPSHVINQDLDEHAINVPVIKKVTKIAWKFFLNIKKKEIKTLIKGVWTL